MYAGRGKYDDRYENGVQIRRWLGKETRPREPNLIYNLPAATRDAIRI